MPRAADSTRLEMRLFLLFHRPYAGKRRAPPPTPPPAARSFRRPAPQCVLPQCLLQRQGCLAGMWCGEAERSGGEGGKSQRVGVVVRSEVQEACSARCSFSASRAATSAVGVRHGMSVRVAAAASVHPAQLPKRAAAHTPRHGAATAGGTTPRLRRAAGSVNSLLSRR